MANLSTAFVKSSIVLSASPCSIPSLTQCLICPSNTICPMIFLIFYVSWLNPYIVSCFCTSIYLYLLWYIALLSKNLVLLSSFLLASVRTFTEKIICKHGKKGQAMAYAIIWPFVNGEYTLSIETSCFVILSFVII